MLAADLISAQLVAPPLLNGGPCGMNSGPCGRCNLPYCPAHWYKGAFRHLRDGDTPVCNCLNFRGLRSCLAFVRSPASGPLREIRSRTPITSAAVVSCPHLHTQRFWLEGEKRWVTLRISTHAMRTIEKKGLEAVLADMKARGGKI